ASGTAPQKKRSRSSLGMPTRTPIRLVTSFVLVFAICLAQNPPAAAPPQQPAPANVTVPGGLNLTNASLLEVIDLLARDLHINYIPSAEKSKVLEPFMGESFKMVSYDPANLLIIQDNSRNMRRTMELIALFDSDSLAGQRVRLFEVKNGRPSDVAKELEQVFKA